MTEPDHPAERRARAAGADFLAGLVIFAVSLYVLISSIAMPYYGDAGALSSPGLTPGLIALMMLVLSGVLMVRSLPFRWPFRATAMTVESWRVLAVFGIVVAYVALMPLIGRIAGIHGVGYAVATFLLLLAFQLAFAPRRDLRFVLVWGIGLSATLTAALWYVFGTIFLIPLP
jgi:hypothetical protein